MNKYTKEYNDTIMRMLKYISHRYTTQNNFAIKTGLGKENVCRWIGCKRRMPLEAFIKICYATGVSPNEFIGWEDGHSK